MNVEAVPIPVLTWHKVSPRWEPGITVVSPARFRIQVQALVDVGARIISLEEYIRCNGRQLPGAGLALLCFDDAYDCVEEHAAPVLMRVGFVATLFPVLGWMGDWNRWDRGLLGRRFRHMHADAIRRLLEHGWSLGLHGRSHRRLSGCSLDQLADELVGARNELELLFERQVQAIAWPYGLCDRRAVRIAQAAGLRVGFGRCHEEHALCRNRVFVYPIHGAARMKAMLAGCPPDGLQRLAGVGAALSSRIGGRNP